MLRDKINDMFENYPEYKRYERAYPSSEGETTRQPRRRPSFRAPFEDPAIDIAEFDKAVYSLGKMEQGLLLNLMVFGHLWKMPLNDMAKCVGMDMEQVELIIEQAKRKVRERLLRLYGGKQ